jgi:hypothetical protein
MQYPNIFKFRIIPQYIVEIYSRGHKMHHKTEFCVIKSEAQINTEKHDTKIHVVAISSSLNDRKRYAA